MIDLRNLTTQQVKDRAMEALSEWKHRLVYDRRYIDAANVRDAKEKIKDIDAAADAEASGA